MADSTPSSQVQIPASNAQTSIPPSHYRGVVLRGGKWASRDYRFHDSKSIWLGTYSTPEMASIAHDVAELAINGDRAWLNFLDVIQSLPVPKSTSIVDIRAAATAAAASAEQFIVKHEVVDVYEVPSQEITEYVDEDELFNMPQLLIEMAEGLMVSPPRFGPPYD
ncbi:ethylene-responsive transcription factor ERF026-like [Dendrobium catenatum]|uniref:ethylene-responsive transcription factor ERF026-like n=1 Tax=Dendrobium catenatum TaxID=906689 RepID=UPI00109FBDF2|nr:ethylene-responsive transcription factor ERF026-like [Dendrobium catenatum]